MANSNRIYPREVKISIEVPKILVNQAEAQ